VLSGPPVELALFLSGRRDAARTELVGDAAAVAKVEATSSGL
jgi:hypothetical protein